MTLAADHHLRTSTYEGILLKMDPAVDLHLLFATSTQSVTQGMRLQLRMTVTWT